MQTISRPRAGVECKKKTRKIMSRRHHFSQDKQLNIYRVLTLILALVLVAVVVIMLYKSHVEKQASKHYSDLASIVNNIPSTNTPPVIAPDTNTDTGNATDNSEATGLDLLAALGVEIPPKNLDWPAFWAQNGDIYAWIYIPNTNVDYPILQHPEDDSYYLMHNLDGSYGYPGCIYTELCNTTDFTDYNTVIYGHNMKDGSMFRSLHYYENMDFFTNCPYIYIYTQDGILVYEVFAAYNSGNEHIINSNDFSSIYGFEMYLNDLIANLEASPTAYYRRGLNLNANNHIITLSTCTEDYSERYLVQAVLLNDDLIYEDN